MRILRHIARISLILHARRRGKNAKRRRRRPALSVRFRKCTTLFSDIVAIVLDRLDPSYPLEDLHLSDCLSREAVKFTPLTDDRFDLGEALFIRQFLSSHRTFLKVLFSGYFHLTHQLTLYLGRESERSSESRIYCIICLVACPLARTPAFSGSVTFMKASLTSSCTMSFTHKANQNLVIWFIVLFQI